MEKQLIKVTKDGVLMDGSLLQDPGAVYVGAVASNFWATFAPLTPSTREGSFRLEVDRNQEAVRIMSGTTKLAIVPLRNEASHLEVEVAFTRLAERYIDCCS